MMQSKNHIFLFLCLVIAVIAVYARVMIPHDTTSLAVKDTSSPLSDNIVTIHYHERPPYYTTGPYGVYGLCADPAKLAFKKAGIPVRWEKTPAKRQLNILKANTTKACLIGWFKNPEREKYAKFTHFIYQDKPTLALSRADNHKIKSIGTLEDLLRNDQLILLRKDGYSYGQFIDTKISQLNPRQMITNSENMGMLKIVHSRQADYFFISDEEARNITTSSGILTSDFKFIRFSNIPEGNKRYLMFSQNVGDDTIKKINAAIKIQHTASPDS